MTTFHGARDEAEAAWDRVVTTGAVTKRRSRWLRWAAEAIALVAGLAGVVAFVLTVWMVVT